MPFHARGQRREVQLLELEAIHPEAFEAADDWIELARAAINLGGMEVFDQATWERVAGIPWPKWRPRQVASAAWRLRPGYEAARLRAKLINAEGREALRALRNQLAREVRSVRDPNRLRGYRIAFWIIEQALRRPDRRKPWSRALRDLDLTVVPAYTRIPGVRRRVVIGFRFR